MLKKFELERLMCAVILGTSFFATQVHAEESLSEFLLEGINITALGYEKSNLATPADTVVYTGEQLKETGASDLANALKYKGGVYFTNMGPHDQNWITGSSQINLRGIDGGTLVLINGLPASFNNVNHLDMINLDEVERVEVVKGGGAVLYGSEALGGVINIITKDQMKNSLRVATGNKGQRDYAATIGMGKASLALGRNEFGSTGNMTEKINNLTINGVSDVGYYIGFGDSKKDHLAFNYKFDDKFKFSYMFNKKKYSINYNDVNETLLKHFMYDDREHFTQMAYNDENGWDAKVYYNQRRIENPDYFVVNPTNIEWEKSDQKQYGLDAKKVWRGDKAIGLLGVSAKRETYKNDNQKFNNSNSSSSTLKPIAHFGTYALNSFSLYGSYDRKLNQATDIIFSAREDFFRSDAGDYNEFLPQVQAITKFDDHNSVYASIGKSFRMPTFRNLYYGSNMIEPNPDLKPEQGWNYEIGYKYDEDGRRFNITAFRTDIKDQIISVWGSSKSKTLNASKYRNTGIELRYEQDVDKHFSYNVGAVFAKPQRMYKEGQAWVDTLGRYQINGGVNYVNRDFNAALNLSYWGGRVKNGVSSEKVTVTEISSPLLVSNLHLGYKVAKNVNATFDVDNLFNRKDIANVGGTSNNNLYYTMGRTFRVGVNYNF